MASKRQGDDSGEEEETAIDLRSSSQAYKKATASRSSPTPPRPSHAPPSAPPPGRSAPPAAPLHEPNDDDEATEFLAARPSSSAGSAARGIAQPNEDSASSAAAPRARGRAVPLEAAPDAHGHAHAPSREPTEPLLTIAPEAEERRSRPEALPHRTPRPLPNRGSDFDEETAERSSTGPLDGGSSPRITRIFVANEDATHKRITAAAISSATEPGGDDEITDAPVVAAPSRPLPPDSASAKIDDDFDEQHVDPVNIDDKKLHDKGSDHRKPDDKRPSRARTAVTSAPMSETLEAEPADGTLIVEVPEGAVVFVNGLERGKGPALKVTDIDRYAKHAVRIHCSGYLPWSGSVCLEGRTAARVRPTLKKRER